MDYTSNMYKKLPIPAKKCTFFDHFLNKNVYFLAISPNGLRDENLSKRKLSYKKGASPDARTNDQKTHLMLIPEKATYTRKAYADAVAGK